MTTSTQYNPNAELNAQLLAAGASKTVYALVTPETERIKELVIGNEGSERRQQHLDQYRDAWTNKQDRYHEEFFETWLDWSAPVVDMDPNLWSYRYPTAGASEGLRHLIYAHAVRTKGKGRIHFFKGEYEGYRAYAEASGLECVEHDRRGITHGKIEEIAKSFGPRDRFMVSQPSAIDGNVWADFNHFVSVMPDNSVVADITYVGSITREAIEDGRFDLNAPSIENVVFSLSKPFGVYYDRIGGVFSRKEDAGLFGNKWFKSMTAIELGTTLMLAKSVFELPEDLQVYQHMAIRSMSKSLGFDLKAADVTILCIGRNSTGSARLAEYVNRGEGLRICLTPEMSRLIRRSIP